MNGCEVILEDIHFHPDKPLPPYYHEGAPHICTYVPESLLVRVPGVAWALHEKHFPHLPPGFDRRGLVLLRPEEVFFKLELSGGVKRKIKVKRYQFKLAYSNTRTSYAAQGEQWNATVCDLQRPPRMTAELHWLACYVMLSRATELDGLLISRLCTREELGRGPPQFLLDELERLRFVYQTRPFL